MAHGQDYSGAQRKIIDRYYDNKDTIATQKLGEIVSDLYLCEDAKKAEILWDRAAKAMANITLNRAQVDKILKDRNVEALAQMINEAALSAKAVNKPIGVPGTPATAAPAVPASPAPAAAPGSRSDPASASSPVPGTFSHEELKTALKAFKKRLKLTKLDEESKLGRSPLSGGRGSGIVAIQPPNQYPAAVWQELVKQGKLKPAGRGFFELLEP